MEIGVNELPTIEKHPLHPKDIPKSISEINPLVRSYIKLAVRNIAVETHTNSDGSTKTRLNPSLIEPWEGLADPYNRLKEILFRIESRYSKRRLLLESLWEGIKGGDCITSFKKGKGNCLDWALAVCLTWNIELSQVDPDKEAFLVPFYLPDNRPHFGVVIMDTKTNQPYAYGVFVSLLVLEEEYEKKFEELKQLEEEYKKKLEELKQKEAHERSEEEIRRIEEEIHLIKYARISLALIRREVERWLKNKRNFF